MAGAGVKTFTNSTLTAAEMNTYLMQQSVMTFASAAARTTAFSAASITPSEGMVSYLTDTNEMQIYTGAIWQTTAISSGTGKVLNVSTAEAASPIQSFHYATKTRITGCDFAVTSLSANSRWVVWHYNWIGSRVNAVAIEIWYQVNGGAFSCLGTNASYATGIQIWNSGSTDLWLAANWHQSAVITAAAGSTINFVLYGLSGGAGGVALSGGTDAVGHPDIVYRWAAMEMTP
jgi:hypothetical protein